MSKSKKAKHDSLPQFRKLLKAKAAGGAARTAGRARVFADKKDKLAKETGDPQIDEGVAEYAAKKNEVLPQPPAETAKKEETPEQGMLLAAKQALEMIDDNHHWSDGFNGKAEGVTGAGLKRAALAFAIKRFEENIAKADQTKEGKLWNACQVALDELEKWFDFAPNDRDLPDIIAQLKDAIK